MNLFQILALLVVGSLLLVSLVAVVRGTIARRAGLLWVLVWLAAGVAIAQPEVTRVIAKTLGIGRGADLLLYCAVVVMLIGFLMTYARLTHLQRDLTLVVRHLATRDAVINTSMVGEGVTTDQEPAANPSHP